MTEMKLHSIISASGINGPGARLVVFFQGCTAKCAGCFNPDTHSFEARLLITPTQLFEQHLRKNTEGVTVSGGEPFLQPRALTLLLRAAKERALSTVVYTGFTIDEIREHAAAPNVLDLIDVLVDGPFIESMKEDTLLARGSSNQSFHFLTERYGLSDFVMNGRAEIILTAGGDVIQTGFSRTQEIANLI